MNNNLGTPEASNYGNNELKTSENLVSVDSETPTGQQTTPVEPSPQEVAIPLAPEVPSAQSETGEIDLAPAVPLDTTTTESKPEDIVETKNNIERSPETPAEFDKYTEALYKNIDVT